MFFCLGILSRQDLVVYGSELSTADVLTVNERSLILFKSVIKSLNSINLCRKHNI